MTEPLLELDVAWQQHVGGHRRLFESLMGRHREKHRTYHTTIHVLRVVRSVKELAVDEDVADLDAVVAAAFYHDAVYEPLSPANERASARLARRDLVEMGWDPERADGVRVMIEGTATHTDAPDIDTAILFDADLAILGDEPSHYSDYVTGVRSEYRHVADGEWVTGRASVLQDFVARAQIYATGAARRRWEERARANIAAELATLGAASSD